MLSATKYVFNVVVSNVGVIAIISSENACDVMLCQKQNMNLDLQYN